MLVIPETGIVKPAPWVIPGPEATAAPDFWRGLRMAVPGWEGTGPPMSFGSGIVGPAAVATYNPGGWVATNYGPGWLFDQATTTTGEEISWDGSPLPVGGVEDFTLAFLARRDGDFVANYHAVGSAEAETVDIRVTYQSATALIASASGITSSNAITLAAGVPYLLVAYRKPGQRVNMRGYDLRTKALDLQSLFPDNASAGTIARGGDWQMAAHRARARVWPGEFYGMYFWDHWVGDSLLTRLAGDPFAPFRPVERRRVFIAASGTPVSQTVGSIAEHLTPVEAGKAGASDHLTPVTKAVTLNVEHSRGLAAGNVVFNSDDTAAEGYVVVAVRVTTGDVEGTDTTDATGAFSISLEPGEYDIYVRTSDGFEALAETSIKVT